MMRLWTIIGVRNVPASYRWYQALFGQADTGPAHDDFGQIRDADGTVLLCLHQWGAHEHPSLTSPKLATPGNGLLLFFRVDDFARALLRARDLVRGLEEEPHVNPSTGTREFSLRDPDGYFVTISSLTPSSSDDRGAGSQSLSPKASMTTDEIAITRVLDAWASATQEGRQDDVLRNHEPHALIYDVLPPLLYASPAAYRASWGDWQPDTQGVGRFELEDLRVTAGADVAFAHGLIQCGGTLPNGTRFRDTVRATFCLTRHEQGWRIAHQHISKPFGAS